MSTEMRFGRSGLGYVGLWSKGGIQMSIDHLRRSRGELHGEMIVESAVVARGRGHLHRASFNLSSSTSRKTLAKLLEERSSPQTFPWLDHLEEFCTAVLDAERKGTPLTAVGNLPAREAESYLIDPLLPARKTTIVYAAGGTGKSYLAVLASVMVALGHSSLGWRVTRGPVLYLDWETDEYEVDERIKRVAAGLGVKAPEILYRGCAAPLEDMAEVMARTVSDKRIALVVIDSVGMASGTAREGGDANESALRLFASLRHLQTTILAIDHITGEDVRSEKAVAKPYGSIYKVNLARSVWELRAGEDQGHLALFHRKVNRGSLHEPIGIAVTHEDNQVKFKREAVDDARLVKGMTTAARIQRAVADGPLTYAQLSEVLDIATNKIRAVVSRDMKSPTGLFYKDSDGRVMTRHGGPQPVAQRVALPSGEVA